MEKDTVGSRETWETHVVIVQERDEGHQEQGRGSVGVKAFAKTNQEMIFNMQNAQDIVSDCEV